MKVIIVGENVDAAKVLMPGRIFEGLSFIFSSNGPLDDVLIIVAAESTSVKVKYKKFEGMYEML